MFEGQVLTQHWIRYYNQVRPHSNFDGRSPYFKPLSPLRLRPSDFLTKLLTLNSWQINSAANNYGRHVYMLNEGMEL